MFPLIVDESFENKVLDISAEEYHSRIDCAHSSSLKTILISPNAYKYTLNNPIKQTRSLKIGSIAHEASLEGSKFLSRYQVMPKFKGFTKKGEPTESLNSEDVQRQIREWKDSLEQGTVILTQGEYDDLRWMLDSLMNHRFAMDIIKECYREHKKQWRDPVTGIAMISSDDLISFDEDIWADLKTCVDPDWDKFRRTVEDKKTNYPFQVGMYEAGNLAVHNRMPYDQYWIALQNCGPWETKVHYIDDYYRKAGRLMFERARRDLLVSLKNNSWPQGQVAIESGNPSKFYKDTFDPVLDNE